MEISYLAAILKRYKYCNFFAGIWLWLVQIYIWCRTNKKNSGEKVVFLRGYLMQLSVVHWDKVSNMFKSNRVNACYVIRWTAKLLRVRFTMTKLGSDMAIVQWIILVVLCNWSRTLSSNLIEVLIIVTLYNSKTFFGNGATHTLIKLLLALIFNNFMLVVWHYFLDMIWCLSQWHFPANKNNSKSTTIVYQFVFALS